jgi:seryl-tRNA synthetase
MTATAITDEKQFLQDLFRHGLLVPSGELGLYGRGVIFEEVRSRFDHLVNQVSEQDSPEKLRFPPFIPKKVIEKAGYLKSFPNLCGVVYSFSGKDAEALDLVERANRGDDWSKHLSATDVALVPAACYPAYPAMALRGPLPKGGAILDLGGCYVFRHEPSEDPARMQAFHQREIVRMGQEEDVIAWRETWMQRAVNLLQEVGLQPALVLASDPFFGRAGKLMANNQREQSLKFEIVMPVSSSQMTAVSSFNFHRQHFSSAFGIQMFDQTLANTACLGFGLERITLALFHAHGMLLGDWPSEVRRKLWPNGNVPRG